MYQKFRIMTKHSSIIQFSKRKSNTKLKLNSTGPDNHILTESSCTKQKYLHIIALTDILLTPSTRCVSKWAEVQNTRV